MKIFKKIPLICFLAASATFCQSYGQQAKHVVLISIDGFRPDFYMDSSWNTPNLKSLMKEGVYAGNGIQSVFPSLTFPAHTTLVTGVLPIRHGIYYNGIIGNDQSRWYWEVDSIKKKTLWEAVKEAGMTSGAVMWPVTVKGKIDYNFPDVWPAKNIEGNRFTETVKYSTPKNLITDFGNERGKQMSDEDLGDENEKMSKSVSELSGYILKKYKPNFMAIHFLAMDHAQHKYGREGVEVQKALSIVDSLVGEVFKAIKLAGIESSTAVVITGDHGFANTRAYFSPNVYLAQNGLITKNSWKAKFEGGPAGFLFLKDRNDKATLKKVKEILSSIPEAKKNLYRIFDRPQLDQMGVDPNVALVLSTEEGISINSKSVGDPYVLANGGGGHGYDPAYPHLYTGFIAVGAGIAMNKDIATIGSIGIKDVAPLIAKLLGLSLENTDGVLIPEVFDQ